MFAAGKFKMKMNMQHIVMDRERIKKMGPITVKSALVTKANTVIPITIMAVDRAAAKTI